MNKILMTPGPTNVPEEVFAAMSQNMHHRTDEFLKVMYDADKKLRKVFGTQNEVVMLLSSGTGGLEASVVNIFSPGDDLLVINCGVFGRRYADISREYGVNVDEIKTEWGQGIEPEILNDYLDKKKYKAVYATYSETSTGIKNDIKKLGSIVKNHGALFIVDAVSAIGSLKFDADKYNVDLAIAGSQKGLMCPPGLSLLALSDRAWDAVLSSKMPRFYFDLRKYKNSSIPYTPGVSLILGLNKALDMLLKKGLDNVYHDADIYSRAVKSACNILGLSEFPDKRYCSEVLTALWVPSGVDDKLLRSQMQENGVVIAGGQGRLKGKIIRIGHIGYLKCDYILKTIYSLGSALNKQGYKSDVKGALGEAETVLGAIK